MMNKECERVGLPQPKISDKGSVVKVIFGRPTGIEEHKLNTSRTPVEHQFENYPGATGNIRYIKVLKLIKVIGEIFYSNIELRNLMGFNSKSSFIRNYLTPAIDNGYVKYEDPSNPTSPNQRYGLTVKGKAIYYLISRIST